MTKVVFDERKFVSAVNREMGAALTRAGRLAQKMMRDNLRAIHGTGKPEWHQQVAGAIKSQREKAVNGIITQLVGLIDVQDDLYFFIKAKLLESGSEAYGPIWHYQGMPGINSDITGLNTKQSTLARASYPLPPEFTQPGAHWFEDAVKLIGEIFDDEVEAAWGRINPWDFIHCR